MRMRTAAGLHGGNLLWFRDIANIENPYAAKTVFLDRGFMVLACRRRGLNRKSLHAAIQTSVRHLDRHKHQVLVNRNIALSARTYHRGQQFGFCRVADVINTDTIEVTQKQVFALKSKIRIGKGELSKDHLY